MAGRPYSRQATGVHDLLERRNRVRRFNRPMHRFIGFDKCHEDFQFVAFHQPRRRAHQPVDGLQCRIVVGFALDWSDVHVDPLNPGRVDPVKLGMCSGKANKTVSLAVVKE